MVKEAKIPKPTEGELELLKVLWDRGPATVREIFEAVNTQRQVIYTGVLKLLQIMTAKGLVVRDERERAHVYRAALAKQDTEQRFMRDLSASLFAGSVARLALRALEMESASDEELDEIRKLLARRKKREVSI